jgi:signal peptidase II
LKKLTLALKKSHKVFLVVLLVLVIDQSLKIWIKTHLYYSQEIAIFGLGWAKLHFVENNGMAFGLSLGGFYGKLALSLFRITAVFVLSYYISLLIKAEAKMGLLISFALILAGAIGNIIDSAFYGLIFSESYHGHTSVLFPDGGGYAGFLHGKVVDMLYFPLFEGQIPEWFPFWGGSQFLFFRPVFNIADMSITIGVLSIILFHRSFFSSQEKKKTIDKDINEESSEVADQSSEHIEPQQDISKNELPTQ